MPCLFDRRGHGRAPPLAWRLGGRCLGGRCRQARRQGGGRRATWHPRRLFHRVVCALREGAGGSCALRSDRQARGVDVEGGQSLSAMSPQHHPHTTTAPAREGQSTDREPTAPPVRPPGCCPGPKTGRCCPARMHRRPAFPPGAGLGPASGAPGRGKGGRCAGPRPQLPPHPHAPARTSWRCHGVETMPPSPHPAPRRQVQGRPAGRLLCPPPRACDGGACRPRTPHAPAGRRRSQTALARSATATSPAPAAARACSGVRPPTARRGWKWPRAVPAGRGRCCRSGRGRPPHPPPRRSCPSRPRRTAPRPRRARLPQARSRARQCRDRVLESPRRTRRVPWPGVARPGAGWSPLTAAVGEGSPRTGPCPVHRRRRATATRSKAHRADRQPKVRRGLQSPRPPPHEPGAHAGGAPARRRRHPAARRRAREATLAHAAARPDAARRPWRPRPPSRAAAAGPHLLPAARVRGRCGRGGASRCERLCQPPLRPWPPRRRGRGSFPRHPQRPLPRRLRTRRRRSRAPLPRHGPAMPSAPAPPSP